MSGALLPGRSEPRKCSVPLCMFSAPRGDADFYVDCTRPAGHPATGHEFVGIIRGQHVHVIWGEP